MASSSVLALLKDHETELLKDRRSIKRKPFCRRVHITAGREQDQFFEAVSRDVSQVGMGTVGQVEWRAHSLAWLTIYLLNTKSVTIEAESRWTEPYGKGWFLTGWTFRELG